MKNIFLTTGSHLPTPTWKSHLVTLPRLELQLPHTTIILLHPCYATFSIIH